MAMTKIINHLYNFINRYHIKKAYNSIAGQFICRYIVIVATTQVCMSLEIKTKVADPPGYMPYKDVVLEESTKGTSVMAQTHLRMKVSGS
jgi:hypothetical protein